MFRVLFVLLCLAGLVSPLIAQSNKYEPVFTPDSSVKYAVGDVLSLPVESQPYIRYLSLYNLPANQRREAAATVSFVVNSLSKRKKIYLPVFVGASHETVIRINLEDYDIDPKEWDNMAKTGSGPRPYPEPYFHAFVEKVTTDIEERVIRKSRQVETGYYVQGRPQYRTEYYDVVEKVPGKTIRVRQLMSAPWLDHVSVSTINKCCQSEFPILRADWFIVNATVEPAYHRLLGLGETDKSFDKIVFADEELSKRARSQMKGVVVKSGVTRNNRTLTREPTFTDGYKWVSRDTLKSVDDRNYVQNFLDEKFDAKEIIASLPNGLQVYCITDGEGKRVDKADNEIATDYTAADKIVRNGRSCMYCHAPGINPIQDEIRILNRKLQNRDQIALLITSKEDQYRIEDLFGTDLDRKIVQDQQIYADAVGLATGLTPQQNAARFHAIWEGYVETLMTPDQVALECGIAPEDLEKYCRLSTDNLFLGLLKKPIRPVRRDQFEQAYQTFMLMIMRAKGINPPAVITKTKTEQIVAGDEVEVSVSFADVYKPNTSEPCARVEKGGRFIVVKIYGNDALVEVQQFGKVWIAISDLKKVASID